MAGLLSSAMIGGVGGLGEGMAQGGVLNYKAQQEDTHAKLLDQLQSEREARNLALKAQYDKELKAQEGHVIAPGSTLQRVGQPDFQAPSAPAKVPTPEEAGHLAAETEELRARGRFYDRNNGKTPRETMPKWIVNEKDDQGNPTSYMDQNSDLIARRVPGTAAVEATAPWYTFGFGDKKGGKPETPSHLEFSDMAGNRVVGPQVRYPDMVKRGAGEGEGATPASAPQTGTRPPLTSFFGGAPAQAAAPSSTKVAPIISAQKPSALPVEQYLTRQRGGYRFNAPGRGAGLSAQLHGRTFASPQEAQAAYDALGQ